MKKGWALERVQGKKKKSEMEKNENREKGQKDVEKSSNVIAELFAQGMTNSGRSINVDAAPYGPFRLPVHSTLLSSSFAPIHIQIRS